MLFSPVSSLYASCVKMLCSVNSCSGAVWSFPATTTRYFFMGYSVRQSADVKMCFLLSITAEHKCILDDFLEALDFCWSMISACHGWLPVGIINVRHCYSKPANAEPIEVLLSFLVYNIFYNSITKNIVNSSGSFYTTTLRKIIQWSSVSWRSRILYFGGHTCWSWGSKRSRFERVDQICVGLFEYGDVWVFAAFQQTCYFKLVVDLSLFTLSSCAKFPRSN